MLEIDTGSMIQQQMCSLSNRYLTFANPLFEIFLYAAYFGHSLQPLQIGPELMITHLQHIDKITRHAIIRPTKQCYRRAPGTSTTGPSDAMNPRVNRERHVIVEDVCDIANVYAPCA